MIYLQSPLTPFPHPHWLQELPLNPLPQPQPQPFTRTTIIS